MDTLQSPAQQQEKSKGRGLAALGSTASTHGVLRVASGFTLVQLMTEFRALRATVLRLWLPKATQMTDDIVADVVRSNEVIDQALAESVITYSKHVAIVQMPSWQSWDTTCPAPLAS